MQSQWQWQSYDWKNWNALAPWDRNANITRIHMKTNKQKSVAFFAFTFSFFFFFSTRKYGLHLVHAENDSHHASQLHPIIRVSWCLRLVYAFFIELAQFFSFCFVLCFEYDVIFIDLKTQLDLFWWIIIWMGVRCFLVSISFWWHLKECGVK